MAISKAAQIDDTIKTYIAEARLTRMQRTVMEGLVDTMTMPAGTDTISIPKFGTVSIAALTEGVDMANPQTISTSASTFTTSEYGAQAILTDTMVFKSSEQVIQKAGKIMGSEMAKKLDTCLSGLFSSFTGGTLGTGSGAFALGVLSAAHAILLAKSEPAPDPFVAVLHHYHLKDLLDEIVKSGVDASYSGMGDQLSKTGLMGIQRLLGIPIYASGNIDATTATATYGAFFSKEAIIHVKEKAWSIEPQRDASLRATELNIVSRFGYGIYNALWGAYLRYDATAPTA